MEKSVTFDSGLEYGATFRFPVTWSYLTATPSQPQPDRSRLKPNQANTSLSAIAPPKPRALEVVEPPVAPVPEQPKLEKADVIPLPPPATIAEPEPVVVAVAAAAAAVPAPVAAGAIALIPAQKPAAPQKPEETRASKSEAKWEMVIPKMARPLTARTQRVLQQAVPSLMQTPVQTPAAAATEISFYAGSEASFLPRRWKVVSLSAAVVVVGCVIAWVRPGSNTGSRSEPASASVGTWSRRTAYLVGAKDPREILVYSGSEDVKNYRIEFAWVPEPRGVGLIFRARDSANYYAAKLRLMQAGAIPTLSAEHFTVIKGVEGAHSRKVITLSRTISEVLVRMDATGPAFTLFLQGSPADYWTDERFESGSLGFYEERGERPALQALRFTLFKKSGLQTVVTSLQ